MATITVDKFLKNLTKRATLGLEDCEKQVGDVFEPVVKQMVELTRPDTGQARAEIGLAFLDNVEITSNEIKEILNRDIYNYWEDNGYPENSSRTNNKYNSMAHFYSDSTSTVFSLSSIDEGLTSQAILGDTASTIHPRNDRYSQDNFPPYHIGEVVDAVNNNSFNGYVPSSVGKEIDVANDKLKEFIWKKLMKK